MLKKRSIFTLGLCFVLFASLLFSNIILAQDGGSYDPWIDTDDDGVIDAIDLQALAAIYSTSGTPINKTELLLELEARLNSLNASLLNDYYNITDCDSLFALLGHLHSGSDISGGTLGVDQIRLGSSEGNSVIYFYEDGSPTTEYLYWQDGSDRFILSDDIVITHACVVGDGLNVDSGTLYVDDANNGVGIGTTGPSYKLHVQDANSPKIVAQDSTNNLKLYMMAANSDGYFGTETNHNLIFVTDNQNRGSIDTSGNLLFDTIRDYSGGNLVLQDDAGNVGIGTTGPATLLDVAGDTTIRGTLNAGSVAIPTTTRYYSLPGCAWESTSSTYGYYSGSYTSTNTPGPTTWNAPVNLPHGAIMTGVEARLYDNHATNVEVRLYRQGFGSLWEIATFGTSGSSPSFVWYGDSSITYPTVDNYNYAYYLQGWLNTGDDNHRLGQVRITYTITETLP